MLCLCAQFILNSVFVLFFRPYAHKVYQATLYTVEQKLPDNVTCYKMRI